MATCWIKPALIYGRPSRGLKTYTTTFGLTENPISESNVWSHNATSWQNAKTVSGRACSSAYTDLNDDAYALLSGFGPNVEAEATIYEETPESTVYELELLLRMADTSSTVRGYECLFNVGAGVDIVRWNGPLTDYTVITATHYYTPSVPEIQTDDKIRARIVGNYITFYWIPVATGVPVLMADATDSTYTNGQPGIGFYVHSPIGFADGGFKDYTVTEV